MLSVVLIGSVLIGTITAFMNARGIDSTPEATIGPATQMAANAQQAGEDMEQSNAKCKS